MMVEPVKFVVKPSESQTLSIDNNYPHQRIVINVHEKAECQVRLAFTQSKKIEFVVNLLGSYAHVSIIGYYRLEDNNEVVISTTQNHLAAHTTSNVIIKGILYDSSRADYQGMIHISAGAKYSNAVQENKNILLSKTAQAQSIPSIEVLTDEVQCAHASAIGYLDRKQLWYLQSRGIDQEQAQQLLLDAFLSNVQ